MHQLNNLTFRNKSIFILFVILFFLFGCGGGGGSGNGNGDNYFPTNVGRSWEYTNGNIVEIVQSGSDIKISNIVGREGYVSYFKKGNMLKIRSDFNPEFILEAEGVSSPDVIAYPMEVGISWDSTLRSNGYPVNIASEYTRGGLSLNVDGRQYSNVLELTQWFEFPQGYNLQKYSTKKFYFAKNIGCIKRIINYEGGYTKTMELVANDDGNNDGPVVTTEIGINGGTIAVNDYGSPLDGIIIDIPPGALDNKIVISINASDSLPPLPSEYFEVFGNTIILEPSGTNFNKPVSVTIPYDPSIIEEEAIIISHYDKITGKWEIPTIIDFDPNNNTLTVEIFHFSEIVRLKPNISSDISISPAFDIFKDAFPILNSFGDLYQYTTCQQACWGFTHASQWFFQNEKDDQCFLRNSYSNQNSANIVCNTQGNMYNFLNRLQAGFGEVESLFSVGSRYVGQSLRTALLIEKTPQYLNIAPSAFSAIYNPDSGHSLLVVSWDETKKVFKVYDPNYNDELKEIKYNNLTGKLGPYKVIVNEPEWEWFTRVSSDSLIYRSRIAEIFQKYPREPDSCLPSIDQYLGNYSGTININYTDGDSSFLGDHDFSIIFSNPIHMHEGLHLLSCSFKRIIAGTSVGIDSGTSGTAMCQVYFGNEYYPDGTFLITGGVQDIMSNYISITGRIEDNNIYIGTNGKTGGYSETVNNKLYIGEGTLSN